MKPDLHPLDGHVGLTSESDRARGGPPPNI